MAKITRYPGNLKAFASEALGTERTIFGDTAQADDLASNITADFLRGWGIVGVNENPTKQDFNGLAYTVSQLIAYLNQMGISEWHADQEYAEHGLCIGPDGRIYQSQSATNIDNNPTTDAINWVDVLKAILPKRSFASADYIRIPDVPGGLIIQWGEQESDADGTQTFTFPIVFPSSILQVFVTPNLINTNAKGLVVLNSSTTSYITWSGYFADAGYTMVKAGYNNVNARILAIGY